LPISCFGNILVRLLYDVQGLPKCDTDRGHNWSEATQNFDELHKTLKTHTTSMIK